MLNIRQIAITWLIGFGLVALGYYYGDRHATAEGLTKSQQLEITSANDALRELSSASLALSSAQATFTDRVLNDKKEISDVLSSIHTGVRRLSIPIKPSTKAASAGTSATASTQEVRAELSDKASEFLIGEASRANEVVMTLDLCQKTVIELDRMKNK